MIAESVRNVLREYDEPFPYDYKDAREREAYFQKAVQHDFPSEGRFKTARTWEDMYYTLLDKKQTAEKERKQKRFQDKKSGFVLKKAFSWALEGDENRIPGYEEYLSSWPIVLKTKQGGQNICQMHVSDLTTNGYGGILEVDGEQYSAELVGCEVYLDPFSKKIGVELENVTGEDIQTNEPFPSEIVDIRRTKAAIKRAFVDKVRENIKYIMSH